MPYLIMKAAHLFVLAAFPFTLRFRLPSDESLASMTESMEDEKVFIALTKRSKSPLSKSPECG
jgi:hypothetical protein